MTGEGVDEDEDETISSDPFFKPQADDPLTHVLRSTFSADNHETVPFGIVELLMRLSQATKSP